MASLLTCKDLMIPRKDLMIPRKGIRMPRKDSTILSPLAVVSQVRSQGATKEPSDFVTCDINSSYANMKHHPSKAVTMPPDDIAHSLLPRARHTPSDFHPP